jgi:hypothetical protein
MLACGKQKLNRELPFQRAKMVLTQTLKPVPCKASTGSELSYVTLSRLRGRENIDRGYRDP